MQWLGLLLARYKHLQIPPRLLSNAFNTDSPLFSKHGRPFIHICWLSDSGYGWPSLATAELIVTNLVKWVFC